MSLRAQATGWTRESDIPKPMFCGASRGPGRPDRGIPLGMTGEALAEGSSQRGL